MRIINQRRNRSINFDNVEIHMDDTRIYSSNNISHTTLLGEYGTEERATEVFEEMHKAYGDESMLIMNNMDLTEEAMEELKGMKTKTIFAQTSYPSKIEHINGKSVYYMPTS